MDLSFIRNISGEMVERVEIVHKLLLPLPQLGRLALVSMYYFEQIKTHPGPWALGPGQEAGLWL